MSGVDSMMTHHRYSLDYTGMPRHVKSLDKRFHDIRSIDVRNLTLRQDLCNSHTLSIITFFLTSTHNENVIHEFFPESLSSC
jgi:hypothetical protein